MTAFGLGSVVVASDPAREKEEAFIRLRLAQLQVQTTPQTVPLTPRPKGTQPQKSVALSGGLPTGAIARLGDTRLRHAAPATCLAFSPDSRQIITGGPG